MLQVEPLGLGEQVEARGRGRRDESEMGPLSPHGRSRFRGTPARLAVPGRLATDRRRRTADARFEPYSSGEACSEPIVQRTIHGETCVANSTGLQLIAKSPGAFAPGLVASTDRVAIRSNG